MLHVAGERHDRHHHSEARLERLAARAAARHPRRCAEPDRDGRTDRATEGGDDQEQSDADSQGDIDYSLLQLKAQTLARIEEALKRLDRGQHGVCQACGHKIAEQRLRALPFAVRCRGCEAAREAEELRARKAGQAPTAAIFPGVGRP